jgi:hypothetical protein
MRHHGAANRRAYRVMKKLLAAIALTAGITACAPPQEGCGLIGCITTPYLRARGTLGLQGAPVSEAIMVMGGAPTSNVDIGNGQRVMTWQRDQNDREFGFLSCSETITTEGQRITQYMRRGHCGGNR